MNGLLSCLALVFVIVGAIAAFILLAAVALAIGAWLGFLSASGL